LLVVAGLELNLISGGGCKFDLLSCTATIKLASTFLYGGLNRFFIYKMRYKFIKFASQI